MVSNGADIAAMLTGLHVLIHQAQQTHQIILRILKQPNPLLINLQRKTVDVQNNNNKHDNFTLYYRNGTIYKILNVSSHRMFRAVPALLTILLVLTLGQTLMEALDVWLVVRKHVDFVVQENF